MIECSLFINPKMCMQPPDYRYQSNLNCMSSNSQNMGDSVQVNLAAESGDMGILANHVPSIEQLKPGLVEIIEESGGSKQFFRTSALVNSLQTHGQSFPSFLLSRSNELAGGPPMVDAADILIIPCSIWRICHCSTRLNS